MHHDSRPADVDSNLNLIADGESRGAILSNGTATAVAVLHLVNFSSENLIGFIRRGRTAGQ